MVKKIVNKELVTTVDDERCWQIMNWSPGIRNQCIVSTSSRKEPGWILNQIGNKNENKILDSCKRCPWFIKTIIENANYK